MLSLLPGHGPAIPDSQTSHPAEVMVVLKVFEKPSGEFKCREERWWAFSA